MRTLDAARHCTWSSKMPFSFASFTVALYVLWKYSKLQQAAKGLVKTQ